MVFIGLEIEGLIRRYRGFQLGPIDLRLEESGTYGLLGANGAGKTTLLNCVCGQTRPDAGRVTLNGQPIQWGDWRYRDYLNYVPETQSFYQELTVEKTLEIARSLFSNWNRRLEDNWINRLDLDRRKKVKELSKGMRVKLDLVLGAAHGARLLLLDEPTAGLDPSAREELYELIRSLMANDPVTLLISSHLFEDIEALADRVLVLKDGKLAVRSSTQELSRLQVVGFPKERFPAEAGPCWESGGVVWTLIQDECCWSSAAAPLVQRQASVRDLYFAVHDGGYRNVA